MTDQRQNIDIKSLNFHKSNTLIVRSMVSRWWSDPPSLGVGLDYKNNLMTKHCLICTIMFYFHVSRCGEGNIYNLLSPREAIKTKTKLNLRFCLKLRDCPLNLRIIRNIRFNLTPISQFFLSNSLSTLDCLTASQRVLSLFSC